MPSTTTARVWRRSGGPLPQTLELGTEPIKSTLEPNEVLIRIHAVSLNYRDGGMLHGRYPEQIKDQGIPTSDCAAEVVDKGSRVDRYAIGDHVSVICDLASLDGTELDVQAIGCNVDGVLRDYAIYDQVHLFPLPNHLSWEEGATISCAGVTAWNALNLPDSANSKKVALLQGTGGVSMFSLLLCLSAGIRPIITSSSDDKLRAVQKLAPEGVIGVINYKTSPEWGAEAQKLTDGLGVDIVIENGGLATVEQSLAAIGRRGLVSLVGFLGGLTASVYPDTVMPILGKSATMRGIAMGSKLDYEELSAFLDKKKINLKPLIDRTFEFEDSLAAFDYLLSGKFVGKIIIKV